MYVTYNSCIYDHVPRYIIISVDVMLSINMGVEMFLLAWAGKYYFHRNQLLYSNPNTFFSLIFLETCA